MARKTAADRAAAKAEEWKRKAETESRRSAAIDYLAAARAHARSRHYGDAIIEAEVAIGHLKALKDASGAIDGQ